MSSRIRSDFGTLADRARGMQETKATVPGHAWAKFGDGWRPVLLVRWIRNLDGTWAGEVAAVDDTGQAGLFVIAGSLLRADAPVGEQ
ncbi:MULTISPECIES: hypothetical protein [unclassified Luteococcus]|uniref:hypothetical protein n=1 Tax=unclassified Luteococcus TaxID=2639923 RepID=UPI00313A8BB7